MVYHYINIYYLKSHNTIIHNQLSSWNAFHTTIANNRERLFFNICDTENKLNCTEKLFKVLI